MANLITYQNLDNPDDFYAELLAVHENRSKEESDAINARLLLILANHIGDREVLRQAFAAAKQHAAEGPQRSSEIRKRAS